MVKHRTPAMDGKRLADGLIALGYTVSTGSAAGRRAPLSVPHGPEKRRFP